MIRNPSIAFNCSVADAGGVAIRAGHHCTQPLLKRFGVPATARASFAFYNDFEDVERLVKALTKMKQFFC